MNIDLTNKKILLVRNDNIGDLICTTPVIEALRKRYPNNQIDIVVNSYNFDAINQNSFVDKIYCYTKPKHRSKLIDKIKAGLGKLKILWKIKKEGYDVVVVFRSDYSKSAELFANITNAKYKVGIKNPNGKDNFNLHVEVRPNTHEVEFCFDCLAPFGVEYNQEKTFYYVDEKFEKKYVKFKGYILFHISSRIKENKYPKEKFKEVINSLKLDNILISCEPMDLKDALWLEKNTKAKFVKTSSLNDLGGVIKNIKLFITLYGGAMHLGPAIGTKTIAFSGKTNMKKWHPWGYEKLVVQDKSKIAENISTNEIVNIIKREI